MLAARCFSITGWEIRASSDRWISNACWWRRHSSCRDASEGGCGRLAAISNTASLLPSLVVSCLLVSACHRTASVDVLTATGRCTSHVRSKGQVPQLPADPPLGSGYGAVIGTLSDSGGALP